MAARITAQNYESLKDFCSWFWDQETERFDKLGIPAEHRPGAVVLAFEQKSMAIARQSIRMGIGDIIEQTQHIAGEQLAKVDAALAQAALPTLSEVRLNFWGKVEGIMRRGKVRSEGEYYALRNVVEAMPPEEERRAWQMLGEFELRVSSKGQRNA